MQINMKVATLPCTKNILNMLVRWLISIGGPFMRRSEVNSNRESFLLSFKWDKPSLINSSFILSSRDKSEWHADVLTWSHNSSNSQSRLTLEYKVLYLLAKCWEIFLAPTSPSIVPEQVFTFPLNFFTSSKIFLPPFYNYYTSLQGSLFFVC